MKTSNLILRWLGTQAYETTWQAMQAFTQARTESTPDEIWLLEHDPVFTQGQNGQPEHLLNPGNIPVIQTDRGGQITYHGPGQLMLYILLDLRRKQLNVRSLVTALEASVIDLLAAYQLTAYAKPSAPGVYVNTNGTEAKICSIGLRIRKGCSYHGIAFNIAMDLEPFNRINPCGFKSLQMTDCERLGGPKDVMTAGKELITHLLKRLEYDTPVETLQTHVC